MGIGADPLYHKNVDSLYCLFDSGNDPSVSWTYSMVKRMGKDLGNIMRQYEPVNALFISIFLEFSCILYIGLLVYFGNKMSAKSAGTFAGALIAVLDICVSNDWLDWAYGVSPVSLAQLGLFYGFAPKWGINLAYAKKFFMIAIVSLSALCVAANYREKVINRIIERRIHGR